MGMQEEHSMAKEHRAAGDERAVRRARRQALIDAGINPYPIKRVVTARRREVARRGASRGGRAEDQDRRVSVAGRIRALRNQGKLMFIVLEDVTGRIQLFCRINNLAEADWALLGQLDVGDIVGATGTVLRTRRGELSVAPTSSRCSPSRCARCPRSSTASPTRRCATASATWTSS